MFKKSLSWICESSCVVYLSWQALSRLSHSYHSYFLYTLQSPVVASLTALAKLHWSCLNLVHVFHVISDVCLMYDIMWLHLCAYMHHTHTFLYKMKHAFGMLETVFHENMHICYDNFGYDTLGQTIWVQEHITKNHFCAGKRMWKSRSDKQYSIDRQKQGTKNARMSWKKMKNCIQIPSQGNTKKTWEYTGILTYSQKLAWSKHDGFLLDQPGWDCGARSMAFHAMQAQEAVIGLCVLQVRGNQKFVCKVCQCLALFGSSHFMHWRVV